jgi:hypothetical protein
MKYSYDDIYGCDLDTYCATHNTDVESLVEKIDRDIELLNHRLKYLVGIPLMDQDVTLINFIYRLIGKKQKHKERLQGWS